MSKLQKAVSSDGKLGKYSIGSRVMKIVLGVVVLVLLVAYESVSLGLRSGSFTVFLERESLHGATISLSETEDFEIGRDTLYCKVLEEMTNMCGVAIPEDITEHDGSHNGLDYIAFTFYVKNAGDEGCTLIEKMNVESFVKDVPSAIRIAVYRGQERTIYAKFAKDGSLEPHYCDVGWEDKTIFENQIKYFQPGNVLKYTVVIWVEGDDPECLDNIRGGNVKLSMKFSVSDN
ncbi:MAG: hypothetical protein MJ072_04035 [Clostridia bacterium]|nr:hypothetical protein [Clostridia bacterium]